MSKVAEHSVWLLLTDREAWALFRRARSWRLHEYSSAQARKLRPGDRAIVYLTKGGSREPSAVAGVIRIEEPMKAASGAEIFSRLYPYEVKFNIETELNALLEFKPLVQFLSLVKNKRYWGTRLQGQSALELSPHDAEVLLAAVAKAPYPKSSEGPI